MIKEISPLDGRYYDRLSHLGDYFSEYALMRSRVLVELRFLLALNESGLFEQFTSKEIDKIRFYQDHFSEADYQRIKEIEKKTNHDVKSCEIFLQEKLDLKSPNMIHFGLTSEDVNNLAYTFLFKDYLEKEQLPQIETVLKILIEHAANWKDVPFPARTHGQMASPSTGGKEMAVFLIRLIRQYERLKSFSFLGKLNGATGNYSALKAAFPKYNWIAFSEKFMEKYGLKINPATTQIEDHDTWAEYFSITKRINNIILDMDRDIWLYLTLGYLTISADKGAVGSSTMPHKVNPINFENSEGNMQVSIALFNGLIDKLGNSRLQRDLSDSTVTRNIGVALAHSYLAIQET
ncbi:MAG: lyase family protein, partial [Calditrichaceae bacterium]